MTRALNDTLYLKAFEALRTSHLLFVLIALWYRSINWCVRSRSCRKPSLKI